MHKLFAVSKRQYLKLFTLSLLMILIVSAAAIAEMKKPDIMHPLHNPPKYTDKGACDNCGMMLNMWARTRYAAEIGVNDINTCSIHCLADMAVKAGEEPNNATVAVYKMPEKMVAAEKASYVVGSGAAGTMTMMSKIAFDSADDAKAFAAEYGGEVMDFDKAFEKASAELEMSRPKIQAKRIKTGKIKEPSATDKCVVCGMPPANFPKHRSQILTMEKNTLQFCSTKCLFTYLENPAKFKPEKPAVASIWVTVYPDVGYDYAKGLYYVVGSDVMGSMGLEALPFRSKMDALGLTMERGGKVVGFNDVSLAKITGRDQ